ncbi:MAG: GH2, partial [uncultured Gemmatimonadaceae bacterium]
DQRRVRPHHPASRAGGAATVPQPAPAVGGAEQRLPTARRRVAVRLRRREPRARRAVVRGARLPRGRALARLHRGADRRGARGAGGARRRGRRRGGGLVRARVHRAGGVGRRARERGADHLRRVRLRDARLAQRRAAAHGRGRGGARGRVHLVQLRAAARAAGAGEPAHRARGRLARPRHDARQAGVARLQARRHLVPDHQRPGAQRLDRAGGAQPAALARGGGERHPRRARRVPHHRARARRRPLPAAPRGVPARRRGAARHARRRARAGRGRDAPARRPGAAGRRAVGAGGARPLPARRAAQLPGRARVADREPLRAPHRGDARAVGVPERRAHLPRRHPLPAGHGHLRGDAPPHGRDARAGVQPGARAHRRHRPAGVRARRRDGDAALGGGAEPAPAHRAQPREPLGRAPAPPRADRRAPVGGDPQPLQRGLGGRGHRHQPGDARLRRARLRPPPAALPAVPRRGQRRLAARVGGGAAAVGPAHGAQLPDERRPVGRGALAAGRRRHRRGGRAPARGGRPLLLRRAGPARGERVGRLRLRAVRGPHGARHPGRADPRLQARAGPPRDRRRRVHPGHERGRREQRPPRRAQRRAAGAARDPRLGRRGL